MKKLVQISFLFVFATILVVIGHSDITLDYKRLWIFKWVYTFHMPLFFFLSGFLFFYTNPRERLAVLDRKRFLWKKVKRLLLPYWFISSVIFVIKARFIDTSQMQHPLLFDWHTYFDILLFRPVGFMWFLPALFVIFLLFVLIKRFVVSNYIQRGGVILFFILPVIIPEISFFKFSTAIYYSGYFALGIIYCTYKQQVDDWLKKYRLYILPISFLLSVCLIKVKLIAALVGILFSLSLSLVTENHCGRKVLALSNFTYAVFLLSYFPQMFIRGPIAHGFPEVNQYVLSAISTFVGFTLPVLVSMGVVKLKEKSRLVASCAFLIGL